jgi:DNA-binding response OmpR family regulator
VASCVPALVVVFDESDLPSRLASLARLRAAHARVPIVCTANVTEVGAVLGRGATDFFLRPYRIEELLPRLAARTEQFARAEEPSCEEPAPDTVGRRSGQVQLEGKAIALHASARRILIYLCDNAGRAISVEELQSEVLHTKGRSHTVHNHIYEIRKAFRIAGVPNLIRTHKGAGCFSVSTQVARRFPSTRSNAG